MTERFQKAYDALVNAFFNGTLVKGQCTACAVGNIVASGLGGKLIAKKADDGELYFECKNEDGRLLNNYFWRNLFMTKLHYDEKGNSHVVSQYKIWEESPYIGEVEANLLKALTGYSMRELARVEHAFEVNTKISSRNYYKYTEQEILEDQYNGLCAVFEVMCELDNIEVDYKVKLQEKEGLVLSY